jgi:hypothetical protein
MNTTNTRLILPLLLAACAFAQRALAQPLPPVTFQRNPLNTFLLHPHNSAAMPQVIELASINAVPGDCIEFVINGSFQCQMPGNPTCVSKSTAAIFSSTNIVLPNTQTNRVPGAIDAGLSIVSQVTCGPNGVLPTDIPFDFRVDVSPLVKVPEGALYMIIGTHDCYNGDNVDTDGDFQLVVTVIKHTVCPADIAPAICRDNDVNVDDLLAVINSWGPCADINNCPADIAPPNRGDDAVNVDDLLMIINNWGTCAP